jgi:hypothetical protein
LASPVQEAPTTTSITIAPAYKGYASVDALAAASDLVVRVTVGKTVGRQVDRGGLPQIDPATGQENLGVPLVFFEANVDEAYGASLSKTIVVATLESDDPSPGAPSVALSSGEQLVLFLQRRNSTTAPGIAGFPEFYVPTSGPNGMFDVHGEVAVPRAVVAVLSGPVTTQVQQNGQTVTVGLPVSKGLSLASVKDQASNSVGSDRP